jgi:hypothetical protein
MPYTVTVTPAIVWTDTTPATAANLNLASSPIMSLSGSGDGSTSALGAGSVTATMLTEDARHDEAQYAASTQGTDTYAITLPVVPVSYTVGMVVRFKADVANTGAATLNVNSLGAKALVSRKGAALADNDIAASAIVTCVYDGTNFQVMEVTPAASITTAHLTNANVTADKLAAAIAGAGLAGGAGTALSVNVDDSTIEIATDTLRVKDGGITAAKLATTLDLSGKTITLPAAQGILAAVNFSVGAHPTHTITKNKSYNVGTVTRDSEGVYSVPFTTPLADDTYLVLITVTRSGYSSENPSYDYKTVSGFKVHISTTSAEDNGPELSVLVL